MALRFIKQKDETDCGVCSAAMVARASYNSAKLSSPVSHVPYGLNEADLRKLLRKLTGKKWKHRKFRKKKDFKNYVPAGILILGIERGYDKKEHWLATDGNYYYDPAMVRPVSIEEATLRPDFSHWKICNEIICLET